MLLIISCRASLVVINPLSFYLCRNVLIYPLLWKEEIGFLVEKVCFCFLALQIYWPTVFQPPKFLTRNLLIFLLRISHMEQGAFLLLLSKFSLSLVFKSLIIMYFILGQDTLSSSYLEFTELLVCLFSCLSTNLGNFQSLLVTILSLCLSPSSSRIPTVCM